MTERDEVLRYIKERGNWLVIIRPYRFEEKRITLQDCFNIILRSIVSFRPYKYPHYYGYPRDYSKISYGDDYVECISNVRPYMGAQQPPKSIWRMYQTGQFVHRFSCMEDSWEITTGKNVFSIGNAVYTVTEIYEFASRLVNNKALDSEITIRIELHNMKDRKLVHIPGGEQSDRLSFLNFTSVDNDIIRQKDITSSKLVGDNDKLALDHTMSLLTIFGWSSISVLRQEQEIVREHISSGQIPIGRQISFDDPVRDRTIFKERLMEELCRRYRFMVRNTGLTDFVFSVDDIRSPGMEGFERPYFDRILPEIQDEEGYIEVLSDGRVRLTDRGMTYCSHHIMTW